MAKKKISKAKKVTPQVVSKDYTLVLHLGGKTYEGTGTTMLEALKALPNPRKVVSRGQLEIHSFEAVRTRQLNIPQIKRLFYPLAQQILAKQLSVGMK